MNEYLTVAARVSGVFLLILAGGIARRLGWLTKEADRTLASLTANVLLPAFYIDRILHSPDFDRIGSAWMPPLLGFISTAIGFGLAGLCVAMFASRLRLPHRDQQRAFILSSGICNYGYIPLPLAEQLFPSAIVTLMIHNVGVDLALWSIGILVLSGDYRQGWKRALRSPPLIAVTIALVLRKLGGATVVPSPLLQVVQSLGQAAVPLGLLLSGAIIVDFLRQVKLSENQRVFAVAGFLRLLLIPMIILTMARYLPLTPELRQVLLLQAAMPSATFPIVLVRLYGQDTATAVRVVLGTSLLCLITMPLWIVLGSRWLQL